MRGPVLGRDWFPCAGAVLSLAQTQRGRPQTTSTPEVGAWELLWSPGRSGYGASDPLGAHSVPPTLDLHPWCPRWGQALLQPGQCVWLVWLTFCGSHLGLGLLAQSRPHAPAPTGPGPVDRVGPGPSPTAWSPTQVLLHLELLNPMHQAGECK